MSNELHRILELSGIIENNTTSLTEGKILEQPVDEARSRVTPSEEYYQLHPLIRKELVDQGVRKLSHADFMVLYDTVDKMGGFDYETSPEEYSDAIQLDNVTLDPVILRQAIVQLGLKLSNIGDNKLHRMKQLSGVTEQVVGDLHNGYDLTHRTSGSYSDFFPTGADSNVTNTAGPASARQGDNPMQKAAKEPVSEAAAAIHRELVQKYRDFITR